MKYEVFGDTGLTVSKLALGGGPFGSHMSEEESFTVLDAFVENGGTMLDTANIYGRWAPGNAPRSELCIGKWLKERKIRDKVVLDSKCACPNLMTMHINRLSAQEVAHDLHESLRNLNTDYLDFFWLHHDDPNRPVEEILETLNRFWREGKILHFGLSNWRLPRIRKAVAYAKLSGLKGFSARQVMHNLAEANVSALEADRMTWLGEEGIGYHIATQMPIFAYSPQAQGYFTLSRKPDFQTNSKYAHVRSFYENAISSRRAEAVATLAKERNCDPTQIALAFLLNHQYFQIIPIIGAHSVQELQLSLGALEIELSLTEMEFLQG